MIALNLGRRPESIAEEMRGVTFVVAEIVFLVLDRPFFHLLYTFIGASLLDQARPEMAQRFQTQAKEAQTRLQGAVSHADVNAINTQND